MTFLEVNQERVFGGKKVLTFEPCNMNVKKTEAWKGIFDEQKCTKELKIVCTQKAEENTKPVEKPVTVKQPELKVNCDSVVLLPK